MTLGKFADIYFFYSSCFPYEIVCQNYQAKFKSSITMSVT